MTNFEMYKNELMEIEGKFGINKKTGEVVRCDTCMECEDCIFFPRNCAESEKIQWLYKEYKEPILSKDELELIDALSKISGKEYKYIYRRDKYIFIFSDKPNTDKHGIILDGSLEITGLIDLFSNIKFEYGLYDIENKCFIK